MVDVLEELATPMFRIVKKSFFIFLTTLKIFLNFANKIPINTASWPMKDPSSLSILWKTQGTCF